MEEALNEEATDQILEHVVEDHVVDALGLLVVQQHLLMCDVPVNYDPWNHHDDYSMKMKLLLHPL